MTKAGHCADNTSLRSRPFLISILVSIYGFSERKAIWLDEECAVVDLFKVVASEKRRLIPVTNVNVLLLKSHNQLPSLMYKIIRKKGSSTRLNFLSSTALMFVDKTECCWRIDEYLFCKIRCEHLQFSFTLDQLSLRINHHTLRISKLFNTRKKA